MSQLKSYIKSLGLWLLSGAFVLTGLWFSLETGQELLVKSVIAIVSLCWLIGWLHWLLNSAKSLPLWLIVGVIGALVILYGEDYGIEFGTVTISAFDTLVSTSVTITLAAVWLVFFLFWIMGSVKQLLLQYQTRAAERKLVANARAMMNNDWATLTSIGDVADLNLQICKLIGHHRTGQQEQVQNTLSQMYEAHPHLRKEITKLKRQL